MTALLERIRQLRDEQTLLENSAVGESRYNGVVEQAVQEVEGMICRAACFDLLMVDIKIIEVDKEIRSHSTNSSAVA